MAKAKKTPTREEVDVRVQQMHAEKYPDGCRSTWDLMCEDCAARLGHDAQTPPTSDEKILSSTFNATGLTARRIQARFNAKSKTVSFYDNEYTQHPQFIGEWGVQQISMSIGAMALQMGVEAWTIDCMQMDQIREWVNGPLGPRHHPDRRLRRSQLHARAAELKDRHRRMETAGFESPIRF